MRARQTLWLCVGLLAVAACDYSSYGGERHGYAAIKMKLSDLRTSVAVQGPSPLEKPGMIYLKDNLLFVNEQNKGIHVFDNTDPAHPSNLSFISILGNKDMSMKDNILYADNTVDLVVIDITDAQHPQLVRRLENVLPALMPTDAPIVYTKVDPSEVVIDWKDTTYTE